MKAIMTEIVELSKEEIETIRRCWEILDELTDKMTEAGFSERDSSVLDVTSIAQYNLGNMIDKLNLY